MRQIQIITVIAAVLGGLAGASAVLASHPGRSAHQDFPPRPGATPIVIGIPGLSPKSSPGSSGTAGSPVLNPGQRASARSTAFHDQYVRALVGGRALGTVSSSAWIGANKQLLGAIVRIPLRRPASITGQWLALRRKPYRASYHHVVALRAFVDARAAIVVALVPSTR